MHYLFCGLLGFVAVSGDAPAPPSPKVALQAFNDLVGTWRCTGTPAGSFQDKQKGFWTETLTIEWQFKGDDAWLKLAFDKGKHFRKGELRYRPATKDYELRLQTLLKEMLVFAGTLDKRVLTVERAQGEDRHRLVFTLLHHNRFVYRSETRPAGKSLPTKHWSVGATKEGESFAAGDGKPECIVSGGAGTMAVMFQGKTYYVCCSGCRDEFLEHPQMYIDELKKKSK